MIKNLVFEQQKWYSQTDYNNVKKRADANYIGKTIRSPRGSISLYSWYSAVSGNFQATDSGTPSGKVLGQAQTSSGTYLMYGQIYGGAMWLNLSELLSNGGGIS